MSAVDAVLENAGRMLGGVKLKETALVRVLGLTKIPVLFFVGPRVLRADEEGCEVKIPLNYRTRNHLNVMYFGVLAAGADIAGGLSAALLIWKKYPKVALLFKDFHAEFLKRADGDVHFTCNQGREIRAAVEQAVATGERITMPVEIIATVPSKYGDDPVAKFTLGLSMKNKA